MLRLKTDSQVGTRFGSLSDMIKNVSETQNEKTYSELVDRGTITTSPTSTTTSKPTAGSTLSLSGYSLGDIEARSEPVQTNVHDEYVKRSTSVTDILNGTKDVIGEVNDLLNGNGGQIPQQTYQSSGTTINPLMLFGGLGLLAFFFLKKK